MYKRIERNILIYKRIERNINNINQNRLLELQKETL